MKLVVLVRQDLKLPKGKLAAQVAHAAVECALKASKSDLEEWHSQGQAKIVLKVADEKEMLEYLKNANAAKIHACVITDAGRTVVEPGTKTVVGIGPDSADKIDKVTGKLALL